MLRVASNDQSPTASSRSITRFPRRAFFDAIS